MTDLHEAYRQLVEVLEEMELPFAIGGSIASATFGVARATQDIDLVIDLNPGQAFLLAQRLEDRFAVDPEDARDAISRNCAFNLIHLNSAYKFDIFPATFFAHGQDELRRRRMVSGTGLVMDGEVPVVSPEDIILAKLAWYRKGNETSERQWRDLESVWQTRGEELDRPYLEQWASKMRTSDLLRKLIGEESG